MKRIICFLLCVFSFVPLISCMDTESTGKGHSDAASKAVAFTDGTGNEVVLSSRPKRVAVLFSSYAELWQLAGGQVSVTVGESIERGFVLPETPLVDSGAGKNINFELLISSKPDFVIGSADIASHVTCADLLRDAGIPAALFALENFEDYLHVLSVMTDITGDKDAYMQYGEQLQDEIEALLKTDKAKLWQGRKILFVRAGSTAASTKAKRSEDHFACGMLTELGCINIADDTPILLDGLSMETILTLDPDYIFFSLMGSEESAKANVKALLNTPQWQALTAVGNGNTVILERELFHYKPNHRWADAYRYLIDLWE